MLGLFSNLTFMQPVLLSGLFALPLIWYILRITPPAPKKIFFPAAHLLLGLDTHTHTTSSTPWWLLLLRLLMIACLICALARPVFNPSEDLAGRGALRIILDNSWASANVWPTQIQTAEEAITQAARNGRDIYILPTTPQIGQKLPKHHGPLANDQAMSIINGMTPNPWAADYKIMYNTIKNTERNTAIESLWLSHGLDEDNEDLMPLLKTLQNQGSLSLITPASHEHLLFLRTTNQKEQRQEQKKQTPEGDDTSNTTQMFITVEAASQDQPNVIAVQALAKDNNLLDLQSLTIDRAPQPATLRFSIPTTMRDQISRFKISGQNGASGIYMLDDQSKRRSVGIVAPPDSKSSTPLMESRHYLQQALEPFAKITLDTTDNIIAQKPDIIIMADITAMPTETLNALDAWVKDGGLLLRFAGPNTAQNRNAPFLMPVTLRDGGRSLSGALSWNEPQSIAPFPENSPLFGLETPSDVHIKQQVLADPTQDLAHKTWASLKDGTPLITANSYHNGMLVLIHTTANNDWSNLPISSAYISILKRIIRLAGQSQNTIQTDQYKALDLILMIDGFGKLVPPSPIISPIPITALESTGINAQRPPGIYGRGGLNYTLNLGDHINNLKLIDTSSLPSGISHTHYKQDYEQNLMPHLLLIAFALFCIDIIVMIILYGSRKASLISIALMSLMLSPLTLHAQNTQDSNGEKHVQYAKGLHLAYIMTGDTTLDRQTRFGLEKLAETLSTRTSVEPDGVAALNPENDMLSFFPLIYWPMTTQQKTLSTKAINNIQNYLNHGGTIIFDTRDQNTGAHTTNFDTPHGQVMRSITASLNVPPITIIPEDHVLGRSFYLLDHYPGRYETGTLWVEKKSNSGRDGVSSIIIGSNDWAGAWHDSMNQTRYDRQHELAMRFGINLMMYALTGNYKADQVHIPHILERLGQ